MYLRGEILRQARLAKNLSLHILAERVGISASYLSKLESDDSLVPSPLVEAMLDAELVQLPLIEADPNNVSTEQAGYDKRNSLNELTGKQWIQDTKSIWRQKGLGATHPETKYERAHPAPFSFQDVARLIRFFTKKGMLVVDPFCGVGSTLKAAALEGRVGIGFELSPKWAELAKLRLREETPDDSGQQVWCIDAQEGVKRLPDNSVDFIVTSPPYWGILNKRPDHKVKGQRVAHGLDTNYSSDERDLANIDTYDVFLEKLAGIFNELAYKLVSGRYCAIIVSDFKHGQKFYSFHSDLVSKIDSSLLELQGITILEQSHKALYPYGYPYAYVPNIHHQYILIFRRPIDKSKKKASSSSKFSGQYGSTNCFSEAVARFSELPYTLPPMSSRNWGHPRHSICSFPSKLKPALASILVEYFTSAGSVVLDMMAGSGTVPFEAALQGRIAIGSDISPLAHVVTSAKVQPPTHVQVDAALSDLESFIKLKARSVSLTEMEEEIVGFYEEETAREIIAARQWLNDFCRKSYDEKTTLFITACLAHILHGNRPYALSRRSHNIIPIPPKGEFVYKPLMVSLFDKCNRTLRAPLPKTFVPGQSYRASAAELPIEDKSVDTIITSPPFLGTTHFLRHNRLRLWLVGWDYETQKCERPNFLEHSKNMASFLPTLQEAHRVLRPGGLAIFHIGIVKNVNMADQLMPHLHSAGFLELARVWEKTGHLESHGRTDRGGTHTHGFLFLSKT